MAVEATLSGAATGVNRAYLFCWSLIAVTVAPLILTIISTHSPLYAGKFSVVDVMAAIGAAHVGATSYLLSDPSVRRFFKDNPIKMIAVPLGLIATGIALLSVPGTGIFIPALFIYSLYAVWHFGSQNVGVAAFISVASRGKSVSLLEKRLVRLSAFCGMLGTLAILQPDFMIGKQYVSLDASTLSVIDFFYTFGRWMALGLTLCAVALAISAWRRGEFMHGLSLILCVTFLFTMYVTKDYMIGFGAFAAAHGLQYLVFLFAHSTQNRSERNFALQASFQPLLLIAILIAAHMLWTNSAIFATTEMPLRGVGIIFGLGLAHFWVDQFLWRMKDKDRARWIKEKYGFLFQ